MTNIPDLFGSLVFNENVMREKLPKEVFKTLKKTIDNGEPLDISIANVVANAMKDWALENGATHYTHWFQPMTGITAEKHDSFISPTAGGNVIMEFSGKELIKGEPDASSFPSGGLRATFEARGYTAWDPSSYAFIKEETLCIPTAFCSYSGEVLDKKTPLLRSMEAISTQASRILALFGKTSTRVTTTVGPEQEYFLVDKKFYDERKDLMFTGRTLFGAMSPKGQEMEDHYFGSIKTRVSDYMHDLDRELWKLGILSKTEHNEVAPAQHEMAPIFTTTNIATDHNQLTMELMKKVAQRHDLVCLLHEKPFEGVNGSGKHNNWSMSTDSNENLLEPGNTPSQNAQFLLFLTAVIKAVDDYQDLLRISVASAGNDHRLGADEAPPAVVSIFLGDQLEDVIESIISDNDDYEDVQKTRMKIGVSILPPVPKDTTDRNRTSPFAFTGNKFEFRMLGSSESVACTNIMLNTAVAEALDVFADELEGAEDFQTALNALIKREMIAHKRIIFNGNGYDDAWIAKAEARGLCNYKTCPEALVHYTDEKNLKLFAKHGIYNETEVRSRQEILIEEYSKRIHIEALTMIDMAKKDILPAVGTYMSELAATAANKKTIGVPTDVEVTLLNKLSPMAADLYSKTEALAASVAEGESFVDQEKLAFFTKDTIMAKMADVRAVADALEVETAEKYWPMPTYEQLLFGV